MKMRGEFLIRMNHFYDSTARIIDLAVVQSSARRALIKSNENTPEMIGTSQLNSNASTIQPENRKAPKQNEMRKKVNNFIYVFDPRSLLKHSVSRNHHETALPSYFIRAMARLKSFFFFLLSFALRSFPIAD